METTSNQPTTTTETQTQMKPVVTPQSATSVGTEAEAGNARLRLNFWI